MAVIRFRADGEARSSAASDSMRLSTRAGWLTSVKRISASRSLIAAVMFDRAIRELRSDSDTTVCGLRFGAP
jgi:hypothetical protein